MSKQPVNGDPAVIKPSTAVLIAASFAPAARLRTSNLEEPSFRMKSVVVGLIAALILASTSDHFIWFAPGAPKSTSIGIPNFSPSSGNTGNRISCASFSIPA